MSTVSLVARDFSIPVRSRLFSPSLAHSVTLSHSLLPPPSHTHSVLSTVTKKVKRKVAVAGLEEAPTPPKSCRGRGQKWDFRNGQGIWRVLGHACLSVCLSFCTVGDAMCVEK